MASIRASFRGASANQLVAVLQRLHKLLPDVCLRFENGALLVSQFDAATTTHVAAHMTPDAWETTEDAHALVANVSSTMLLHALGGIGTGHSVTLAVHEHGAEQDSLVVEVGAAGAAWRERHAVALQLEVASRDAPDALPHYSTYQVQALCLASSLVALRKRLKGADDVVVNALPDALTLTVQRSACTSALRVPFDPAADAVLRVQQPTRQRFSTRLLSMVLAFADTPGTAKAMLCLGADKPLQATFRIGGLGSVTVYLAPRLDE